MSLKETCEPCLASRVCFILTIIFYFLKGPGITIADFGTDIINTIHLSNSCIIHTLDSQLNWQLGEGCEETDCPTDNNFNTTGNSTHSNCTGLRAPAPDPIWMRWSICSFFAPGVIMAIYLALSYDTWYSSDWANDWSSNVETLSLIGAGLLGFYPLVLISMQILVACCRKKAKKNDFITDFLPVMMGIEAFGESAPQVVLNGFAIASKYPLSRVQIISITFSLIGTSLRVLEYDMIAEMEDKEETSKSVISYVFENRNGDRSATAIRVFSLFLFYLLGNIARSSSLCLVFLYCRTLAIIPSILNAVIIFGLIKLKYKGDYASSFLFSVNNFFICSNGGPDTIKETSLRLMTTTSRISLTNLTAWQFGSMYYAFHMHERGKDPLGEMYHYNGKKIDFGEHFGIANPAWVCGFVFLLNVFYLLVLRIIYDKGWLPKTEYEIKMRKTTKSRKDQMEDQTLSSESQAPSSVSNFKTEMIQEETHVV